MAYAFALRNRIAALLEKKSVPEALQPGGDLWNQMVLFFETADPIQLRYVGKEWKNLIEYTEEIARGCGSVGSSCHGWHEEKMLTVSSRALLLRQYDQP